MRIFDVLQQRHALQRIRQIPGVRPGLRVIDVPIWRRAAGTRHRARMRLVQHVSYHLSSHGAEPEISALIIALAKVLPVRTFVDVGANFGYYTWLLRDNAPREITAHVFEPDPSNVKLIESTLRRRPGRVTLHPVALGLDDGELPFYLDADSGHRGSLVEQPFLEGQVNVAVRPLDSELDASTLPEAILVKIDVEGAEEMVLAGAERFLEHQPVIVIECYCGSGADKAPAILSTAGYQLMDAVSGGAVSDATNNYLAVPPSVTQAELDLVFAARGEALATRGRHWA